MSIDWGRIDGPSPAANVTVHVRGTLAGNAKELGRYLVDAMIESQRALTFSQDQIDAAVKKVNALPGGDKTPTFWPVADPMPDASDMDFGDVAQVQVPLASLLASNKNLSKTKLVWHCQHPGQTENPSPFTTSPLVLATGDGNVVLDGQHRLAALSLLGQSTWKCWLIQTN